MNGNIDGLISFISACLFFINQESISFCFSGLLKVETFPRTQLYRKSLEHLGREEDKVVVDQEEAEEFDIVETVDDFIERSVENLEDTLEGMVLEE